MLQLLCSLDGWKAQCYLELKSFLVILLILLCLYFVAVSWCHNTNSSKRKWSVSEVAECSWMQVCHYLRNHRNLGSGD